jgi:hypothetical protein
MHYHRWISVDGTPMTAIDVEAYKQYRREWKIEYGLIRLVTLWSVLAVLLLPNITQSIA